MLRLNVDYRRSPSETKGLWPYTWTALWSFRGWQNCLSTGFQVNKQYFQSSLPFWLSCEWTSMGKQQQQFTFIPNETKGSQLNQKPCVYSTRIFDYHFWKCTCMAWKISQWTVLHRVFIFQMQIEFKWLCKGCFVNKISEQCDAVLPLLCLH